MSFRIHRYRAREILFFLCFYLLVFQNPLTKYASAVFFYLDELFALVGVVFALSLGLSKRKKLIIREDTAGMAVLVLIFVLSGLAANVLYRYQPAQLMLKDLYVNLKFFLSVMAGFYLVFYVQPPRDLVLHHTKICTSVLFSILLADIIFNFLPISEYRYGFKVHSLIFGHVTYLAGTCVFLLAMLLFHYEKRNWKYIAMALLVLISTLRSKALAGAAAFFVVFYFVLVKRREMKLRHLLAVGVLAVCLAWGQISFYYIELAGKSARSIMTQTSFQIMKDYFPIGTGFGTFASDVAGEFYSPVYVKYGFSGVLELSEGVGFFSDTFWPIIMGQTGFLGTVSYLLLLLVLFLKSTKVRFVDRGAYAAVLFVFLYLMVSTTSEPTFCNSVSIPLALVLGYAIYLTKDRSGAPTSAAGKTALK